MDDYARNMLTGRALKGTSKKVLEGGLDVSGGLWQVPEFNPYLVSKRAAPMGFAANVTTWNTGANMLSFPKVVYNGATDDTTGNLYTNPMRFAIAAEAPYSDYSEATNPISGRVNITVYTYMLPVIITRNLIDDGQFSVIEYVSKLISENLDALKEYLFLQGTGVGQPRGATAAANATVASSSGGMYVPSGVSAALTWYGITSGSSGTPVSTQGLVGMDGALPPQYSPGAKWYFTKKTQAAIRSLVDSQMKPQWNAVDSYPNFRAGNPASLLGYEVVNSEWVPAIAANALSCILGQADGYYALNRLSMDLQILREVRALKDEWVLFARARFGGDLVEDWKLKLLKCAAS
jgi:HK97 family phage major capsid protein